MALVLIQNITDMFIGTSEENVDSKIRARYWIYITILILSFIATINYYIPESMIALCINMIFMSLIIIDVVYMGLNF